MAFTAPQLLDALYSVTTIPIIPFRNGEIDYDAHAKNVSYLMRNNYLDNDRPRVISVAGTSLIHHVEPEEQTRIFDVTGQVMGNDGLLMSAIAPNPIGTAGRLIAEQSRLRRAPDVFLIMPLTGTFSPEGIYDYFMPFAERYGSEYGARFIYYFRQERDMDAVAQLLRDSEHFVGVKIGTGEDAVQPMIDAVGDSAMVIWGIGDRSTGAAEKGAKGHTSGTAVLAARAADEINNAQRRGDYAAARAVETKLHTLEEIRFANGRAYNYSAVVEAMNQSGFDDIDAGDGSAPFNPPVPADVAAQIGEAVRDLQAYH
ncbi:MAG: dihydrodipicolinate synthase family protein [Litorilinea sp.]